MIRVALKDMAQELSAFGLNIHTLSFWAAAIDIARVGVAGLSEHGIGFAGRPPIFDGASGANAPTRNAVLLKPVEYIIIGGANLSSNIPR
jgi:hypothetical protein